MVVFYHPHVPPAGVWAPAVTAFNKDNDTVDYESAKKYYAYLSRSGLVGLVILGTNAETFLLTREERAQLIRTAREVVGPDYPIMAGVGGHSTKQVETCTLYMMKGKKLMKNHRSWSSVAMHMRPEPIISLFYHRPILVNRLRLL